MGLTKSDINRKVYYSYRLQGLNHAEALSKIPEYKREEIKKDVNKTFIESHFGMSNKAFYISIVCVIIFISILAFSV